MIRALFFLFFLNTLLVAKVQVIVTIVPQKWMVETIGGSHVDVEVMVPQGADPHNYEPKPSQMISISKAKLYITVGLNELEGHWLRAFSSQNMDMELVESHKGVNNIEMHSALSAYVERRHHHHSQDPHIWLNPSNVMVMARNISDALKRVDSKNRESYEDGFQNLLKKIEITHSRVKEILKNVKKRSSFMVFHPAFGHFAHAYGLEQIAIEFEGKAPKPKQLIELIKRAKESKIKSIIIQRGVSDRVVDVIAKEIGANIKIVSPIEEDWSSSLIELAKAIAY